MPSAENKKFYYKMADFLPQIVFECDLTGRLTFVNKNAFDIFGYTEEEFAKGLNVLTVIVKQDHQRAVENIQGVMEGKQFLGNEYSAVKKNGTVFPIMIYSSLIKENATPLGIRGIIIDMTDIRRSEEERIINESKFSAIYDQTHNAVGIIDPDGILLEANRAAKKALGKEDTSFIGKPFWLTPWWKHSPETRTLLKTKIKKALQGKYLRFETSYRNHQQKWRFLDFSIKPVLDQNKNVYCLILEGMDITERKTTQELLRQSEETFRALAENSADVVMRFDKSMRHLYVNPAVRNLFGMDPASFPGKTHEEIGFPPYLRLQWQEAIHQVFVTKKQHRTEFLLPNGIWIDWLLMPEFDIDNEVKAVITSGRDITENKQAEHIMRLVEYGVNHSRDSIFWVETGTRIIYVNEAACRSLGYSRDELLSMKVSDIDPDFPREAWEPYIEKLRKHGSSTHESRQKTKDGRFVPVEITGNYVAFEGMEGCFAFVRDISNRKLAEKERAKLQAQLIQAQKMESVGRLAGGVAHDFNNMLGVISGRAELALKKVDSGSSVYRDLTQIRNAADRSADITRKLLAFARKQTIEPKILDLNNTVESMLSMLHRLIGEDITLSWIPVRKLWPVRMDPSQIDQILANLCVNARDAISGVGKLTIETGMTAFDSAYCADHPGFIPGDFVMLTVSDDGCGMDKNILKNLFEPFFTTKDKSKGTGLGLATVYGIVKQNHGFINVYSEPGRGSTFKIYLPRCYSADEPPDPGHGEKPVPVGDETILVVEDDPAILEMTRMMLEYNGYHVLSASTPAQAIDLAADYPDRVDLLLTDVVLPEMNGQVLAEKLSGLYPQLTCLFMSGYTADVIARQGVLDQGVKFIPKPFSIQNLAKKVREVLDTATGKKDP
ncbi:MAG TPA: PAS domain S-box protein [Desulfotignum sp.]|nr:PAS domain S-box protein [Desulfotignum sp.]